MWSLGRVLDTPEVCRVYVGSFHDEELREPDTAPLLAAEMGDLLADLRDLPHQSATRRVNELVKRARLLKAHCYLLDHLREQMPAVRPPERFFTARPTSRPRRRRESSRRHYPTSRRVPTAYIRRRGRGAAAIRPEEDPRRRRSETTRRAQVYGFEKKKKELLESMPAQFRTVCRARGLSPGDFPDLQKFVAGPRGNLTARSKPAAARSPPRGRRREVAATPRPRRRRGRETEPVYG